MIDKQYIVIDGIEYIYVSQEKCCEMNNCRSHKVVNGKDYCTACGKPMVDKLINARVKAGVKNE